MTTKLTSVGQPGGHSWPSDGHFLLDHSIDLLIMNVAIGWAIPKLSSLVLSGLTSDLNALIIDGEAKI